MREFLKRYRHAWCLLYALIYLPWFTYLEKNVVHYRLIHTRLDDYIPFNEYFIIPYLLWFLYVAAGVLFFLLTSKEEYYRLCMFLFTGMTISLIICTIWPNGQDLRPILTKQNICTDLVRNLYLTDTPTNIFPSIHVYNSIGVHIAVASSERLKSCRIVQFLSGALMISICLATVFLKQHSVIDGIGAALLSVIMYRLVYDTERTFSNQTIQEQLDL